MNKLSSVVLLILLGACSWQQTPERARPTLADLQAAQLPPSTSPMPSVSLEQLQSMYREALATSDQAEIRQHLNRRLADIEMRLAEEQLVDGSPEVNELSKRDPSKRDPSKYDPSKYDPSEKGPEEYSPEDSRTDSGLFRETIDAYQKLIAEQQGNQSENLYQLAKAYELNGEGDRSQQVLLQMVAQYSDANRYIEAQFRLAETYFSAADYHSAVQHYRNVIEAQASPYYRNALYMLAWSYFKAEDTRRSIATFMQLLDLLLLSTEKVSTEKSQGLATTSKADEEILKDCYRMLSTGFSMLQGVLSLEHSLDKQGGREYAASLYRALADYYLSLERYRDAADTLHSFVDRYANTGDAYQFHIAALDVYRKGGFKIEVLKAKKQFVAAYSHQSSYWQARDNVVREAIDAYLKTYTLELASYYHTLAQQTNLKKSGSKKVERVKKAQQSREYYTEAAFYYELFVRSFPDDQRWPETVFLFAESQFEAGDYSGAINNYEIFAYRYSDRPLAVEAAYAAILSYDKLLNAAEMGGDYQSHQQLDWNDRDRKIISDRIDSSLQFVQYFASDQRSVSILLSAAQSLLDLRHYVRAIAVAEQLLQWPITAAQSLDAELQLSTLLIMAQSAFDSGDFPLAESSYKKVLQQEGHSEQKLASFVDRLAASIYKQGELALVENNYALAALHYERIIGSAPESAIRSTAQFEAAVNYFKAKQWSKSVDLFDDFRSRYPNHEQFPAISATLAIAYRELEQWIPAARELDRVFESENVNEVKAELLYQSAQYYERGGDDPIAIKRYRQYAHAYPEPFELNIEAMEKLNALYHKAGDDSKRRFWLQRIIKVDAAGADNRSSRSKYLAAKASAVFAGDAYIAFQNIKLTLPIKKPLRRKKAALKLVLERYKHTADYAVAEFSTLASFRLAQVYGQLSRDLINSQRPKNLDELELEQYEILLEEQAYPFDEKSISMHEKNSQRSWGGVYDEWVQKSFDSLVISMPARYGKREDVLDVIEDIY